jgi:hypothetical protein
MPFTSAARAEAIRMLREGGEPDRSLAFRFGVDPAAIRQLRAELVAEGVKVERPTRGRPKKETLPLDPAFLAAVDYALKFERRGYPVSQSVEVSLALTRLFPDHPRRSKPSEEDRLIDLIQKWQSVPALALVLRVFGYLGTAEEPRESRVIGNGKPPAGWSVGAAYERGRWRRIAFEPAQWQAASWEACGAFVVQRLLRIEPAMLYEKPDGSYAIRKEWKKESAAAQLKAIKWGSFLRRTLRDTLPRLDRYGRRSDRLRYLLKLRKSPRSAT